MVDIVKDRKIKDVDSKASDVFEADKNKNLVEPVFEEKKPDDETKFDISTFIDNNDVFGLDKYIVVGALYLTDKPKLTKKEFLELVDKFLRG